MPQPIRPNWLIPFVLLAWATVTATAQTPFFTEDFASTTLPYALTATAGSSWTNHSGTTNAILANSPGLSYSGLTTAGGSATLTTTGEDVNRSFAPQTSGAVYASFLVNVTTAQATGDYFFHLGGNTIGSTFNARVFVQSNGTGFRLGIAKGNETDVKYSSTSLTYNTTYFLVVKYTLVAGDANDVAELFVQPTLGNTEPASTLTTSSSATDLSSVGTVALRQGTAANAPGLRLDYLRVGNSWAAVTGITGGPLVVGSITVARNSFSISEAVLGVRTAPVQLSITASNVTGPITVSGLSPHIELSQNATNGFLPLAITLPANTSSAVVYARVASTAPAGLFSGTIALSAAGVPTVTVTLATSVVSPTNRPIPLTASPEYFSLTTVQGVPSAVRSYVLKHYPDPLGTLVRAPAGVEVSLSATTGFTSSITVLHPSTPTSITTITTSTIYVRLTGNSPVGTAIYSLTNLIGILAFPSGVVIDFLVPQEALSAPVDVYGTIFTNTTAVTPIATARGLSLSTVATIEGRVTVSDQFGGKLFYVQDATGGIAVFDNNVAYGSQVNLGDLVRLTGPVELFRGKREINGVQSFTRVSVGTAANIPAPVLTTISQLSANEGRLVSLRDVTVGGSGLAFVGATSYPISASGGTAELRIDANSTALVGLSKVATTSLLTGISDRFTSGTTNIVQVLPRIQPDIPGSVTLVLADSFCSGTGVVASTTLTADQTFDFATMNTEFFGADSGTLACGNRILTYDDKGPFNETLQAQNFVSTIRRLNTDMVVLQEVSNATLLTNAVSASLSGYAVTCSDRFSFYFQDQCNQSVTVSGSTSTVFGPTSLSQKVCVLYKTSTVTPIPGESGPMLTDLYNYPNANGWASGRLPYLFVANVTIGGITRKLHVVNIHALSGSGTTEYNRRTEDMRVLKERLDSRYPNANIILAGDYNDRIITSIATGQPSSAWRFDVLPSVAGNTPGIIDNPDYDILTKSLDALGCSSFGANGNVIDHITVSNEVLPGYLRGTVSVFTPGILDYFNTTSDHSPVFARFDLAQMTATSTTGGPIALLTPTYNCTTAAISFNLIGGDGSPVTYFAPGISRVSISTPSGVLEPGLRFDPKTLFISATQNGITVSQTFDYTAYCASRISSGLRTATPESSAELLVTVLGNPTHSETVDVLIPNANGEATALYVTDVQGRRISESTTETGWATVRLGGSVGVYLLQVSTPTRSKTVKIVKE